jgi:putative flippase GtrA
LEPTVKQRFAALLEGPTPMRLLRWLGAGLAFMALSSLFLYLTVDVFGMPVPLATLVTAETCTVLRFLVNHYWVFGQRRPTLKQCLEYHVAIAGAFAAWWIVANVLTALGVHYLLAGILAVPFSTVFNLLTSFLWIWSHRRLKP